MDPLTWRKIWIVSLNLVVLAIFMIVNIAYVQRVDRENDRRARDAQNRLCGIIIAMDKRYQKLGPSADPDARELGDTIEVYRKTLC